MIWKPNFIIGDPNDPYMLRWYIIPRNSIFNIYLHKFLKSDDDRALHDHPWWSLSLCLRGKMVEIYKKEDQLHVRPVSFGSIIYRSAEFAHRMTVNKRAWTIFITGPKVREWGFHCPKGWRPWQEFCSGASPGQVGKGCE